MRPGHTRQGKVLSAGKLGYGVGRYGYDIPGMGNRDRGMIMADDDKETMGDSDDESKATITKPDMTSKPRRPMRKDPAVRLLRQRKTKKEKTSKSKEDLTHTRTNKQKPKAANPQNAKQKGPGGKRWWRDRPQRG